MKPVGYCTESQGPNTVLTRFARLRPGWETTHYPTSAQPGSPSDQDGKPHTIKPRPNPVHHPTRLDETMKPVGYCTESQGSNTVLTRFARLRSEWETTHYPTPAQPGSSSDQIAGQSTVDDMKRHYYTRYGGFDLIQYWLCCDNKPGKYTVL
ncbi:hypothetical protein J6590_044005 [Homalodisca vitripennis]|nr:hypothetical protein J6590_044005 [Homalodisca vitripennis]